MKHENYCNQICQPSFSLAFVPPYMRDLSTLSNLCCTTCCSKITVVMKMIFVGLVCFKPPAWGELSFTSNNLLSTICFFFSTASHVHIILSYQYDNTTLLSNLSYMSYQCRSIKSDGCVYRSKSKTCF